MVTLGAWLGQAGEAHTQLPCFFPRHLTHKNPPHLSPVGVGTVYYLMRKDMRTGVSQLRRNVKTIRGWLEEEASASAPKDPPKKLPPKKDK